MLSNLLRATFGAWVLMAIICVGFARADESLIGRGAAAPIWDESFPRIPDGNVVVTPTVTTITETYTELSYLWTGEPETLTVFSSVPYTVTATFVSTVYPLASAQPVFPAPTPAYADQGPRILPVHANNNQQRAAAAVVVDPSCSCVATPGGPAPAPLIPTQSSGWDQQTTYPATTTPSVTLVPVPTTSFPVIPPPVVSSPTTDTTTTTTAVLSSSTTELTSVVVSSSTTTDTATHTHTPDTSVPQSESGTPSAPASGAGKLAGKGGLLGGFVAGAAVYLMAV